MSSPLPFQPDLVTPEAAALLRRIESHCTVECCDRPFYSAWIRAAVDAAADVWALGKGWPAELLHATFKKPGSAPPKALVAWNATTNAAEYIFGESENA